MSFGALARPVAAAAVSPAIIPAGAGRIRLTGAGQLYVLDGDVEGPLEIAAPGVSVDGNGYTITPRRNGVGVDVGRSRGVFLQDLRIVGGRAGVRAQNARRLGVRDVWIRRSGVGVDAEDASVRLHNLHVVGTRRSGLRLKDVRARVSATTVDGCGRRGRASGVVADTEQDLEFRRCLARDSGRHGFVLDGDDEAALSVWRSGAIDNRGDGFDVEDFTETELRCSVALGNGGSGLDVDNDGRLTMVRVSAVGNDDHGFEVRSRDPARLFGTTAFRNRDGNYRLRGPVFRSAVQGPVGGRCAPRAVARALHRQALDAESAGVTGSKPGTGWLDEFETGPEASPSPTF